MKYNVITFGSATLDIFLKTKQFVFRKEKRFTNQKGVCFPFASKADLEELDFASGGGGTNTAATFSLQGLKTLYCGEIGDDFAGSEVLKDLKDLKIKTDFVFKTSKAPTNLSIIFSWGKDKTCFVWRGASEYFAKRKLSLSKLKADWFYLAPLSGESAQHFKLLVDFAKKNRIKVFANLGNSQIKLGLRKLKPILKNIDIVFLNQEEASLLTRIPYTKQKQIFKKLDQLIDGLVVMTRGKKGAIVSNGEYLWKVKTLPVKVVEKTGAGDAFGSGFLTGLIERNNIEHALQKGTANAASCVQQVGAKKGLLKKNKPWKKIKVRKTKI